MNIQMNIQMNTSNVKHTTTLTTLPDDHSLAERLEWAARAAEQWTPDENVGVSYYLTDARGCG